MKEAMSTVGVVKHRKVRGKVIIDVQGCKGCELCTVECKENALTLSDDFNARGYQYVVVDNGLCTGCVNCALVCPDSVITVYRTNPKKQKQTAAVDEINTDLNKIFIG